MTDNILNSILPRLNKLSEVFRLRRKQLKSEIVLDLSKIDEKLLKQENIITFLSEQSVMKKEEIDRLYTKNKNITKKLKESEIFEKKLDKLEKNFNFISSILSAKATPHEGLEKFITLYKNDFLNFANRESSLAEEAKALLLMQAIIQELELIVYYPETARKNIIAIGGGFSSGKSEFVSSFFIENTIKLPIGLEPVTAIATYVIADKDNKILGFSNKGGSIDIEPRLYESLSHNVVKSFEFNLKDIMPFMTVGTPLNHELFSDVCLIDTPGYDPANTDGFTHEDEDTAFEFISQAHSLIWMINIENGVINQTDLSFLQKLELKDKNLYIVVNQADKRSQDEIEDIVEEISEVLDDEDIEFMGISAYSSIIKKEYYFMKVSLFNFLKEENFAISAEEKILSSLNNVIVMYRNAIQNDLDKQVKVEKSIKTLELDLLQYEGFIDNAMKDKLEYSIGLIKENFNNEDFDNQLKELDKINLGMKNTIKNIFDNLREINGKINE